jgi:hypothetical protein
MVITEIRVNMTITDTAVIKASIDVILTLLRTDIIATITVQNRRGHILLVYKCVGTSYLLYEPCMCA